MSGLVAAALLASTALAQVDGDAEQWNVGERPRPAYDPAGIRAGGVLLFPSIGLGVAGDDNIYRRRDGETRDSIRSVRPRLFGVSQWSNHELEVDVGLDSSFFADAEDENVTNWFAGGAGRLDISRDAWVRAAVNVRELHEERGDPESPITAVSPVSRTLSGAQLEAFRNLNRFNVGIEASFLDIAYEDTVDNVTGRRLVQSDRDRGESEVSARFGWDVATGNELYLRATRYVRRYDRPQGVDGYLRDSDGTEFVAGSRSDLGATVTSELFAGQRRQSYDEDERLPTVDELSYGGALTWNVTPLTSVRGAVRRSLDESTLRQASGYLSSVWELGVEHELRRNLLLGVSAVVTTNRYLGIEREDDIGIGEIRLTWLVNRTVHVDFGYRAQRRESTFERDNYDKDLLYLNIRLQR